MRSIQSKNEDLLVRLNKKRASSAIIAFLSFFISMSIMGSSVQSRDKIVMVFLDASDFDCHLCLSGIVEFIEKWEQIQTTAHVFGVFCPSSNSVLSGKKEKAEEKKLEGFIKGFSRIFPFIYDRKLIFGNHREEGVNILVIDSERNSMKSYKFPLGRKEWEEIF